MKLRHVILLIASAAAAAAFLPGGIAAQDRAASLPPARAAAPAGGMLGLLQHGEWHCALPGDAGGAAFVDVPAESFRIGTASSYANASGSGIYLLRGPEVVFTRGPKKDERFKVLGDSTLQKRDPDGSLSKLICTRVGGGR